MYKNHSKFLLRVVFLLNELMSNSLDQLDSFLNKTHGLLSASSRTVVSLAMQRSKGALSQYPLLLVIFPVECDCTAIACVCFTFQSKQCPLPMQRLVAIAFWISISTIIEQSSPLAPPLSMLLILGMAFLPTIFDYSVDRSCLV